MAAPGFAAAVEAARRLPKGISDGDRLRLYALFKQATVGEAPLANPASRLDVLSSMKWEAWDAVRGLSAAQAEIRYMELVRILTPTTAATPFHRKDTGNAAATQRTQPRLGPRVMVLLVCLFKMLQFIDRGVLGGAPSAFGAFIERTTGEGDSQSLLFAGISSVYSVGTLVGCSVAVAVLARGVAAYALLRAGVSIYILGVLGASMGFWMPDTPSSYYLFLGARAVVGFGAGCVAGFACKKVQNIVVGAAFLTGGIAGGACLAGWVKPEDLKEKAEQIMDKGVEKVHENMDKLTGIMAKLDADGDGKVDLSDSKLVLSKFYKKHSGFSMGLVGGALVGYRMG